MARIEEQCGQEAYISPCCRFIPYIGISNPRYQALNKVFRITFNLLVEAMAVNNNRIPSNMESASPLNKKMIDINPKRTMAAALSPTANGYAHSLRFLNPDHIIPSMIQGSIATQPNPEDIPLRIDQTNNANRKIVPIITKLIWRCKASSGCCE